MEFDFEGMGIMFIVILFVGNWFGLVYIGDLCGYLLCDGELM